MQHPWPLKQGGRKCQRMLNTPKGKGDHEKLHQMRLTTLSAAPEQSGSPTDLCTTHAHVSPGRSLPQRGHICWQRNPRAVEMRSTSRASVTSVARHLPALLQEGGTATPVDCPARPIYKGQLRPLKLTAPRSLLSATAPTHSSFADPAKACPVPTTMGYSAITVPTVTLRRVTGAAESSKWVWKQQSILQTETKTGERRPGRVVVVRTAEPQGTFASKRDLGQTVPSANISAPCPVLG